MPPRIAVVTAKQIDLRSFDGKAPLESHLPNRMRHDRVQLPPFEEIFSVGIDSVLVCGVDRLIM